MGKEIKITWLEDDRECDDCGWSWAQGAVVEVDGVEILDLQPHAHCYNGDHWDKDVVFFMILEKLGYEVRETDG